VSGQSRFVLWDQTAQVNDLTDPGLLACAGEVVGENQIHVHEVGLSQSGGQHRVNQIKCVVGADDGLLALQEREEIAGSPFQAWSALALRPTQGNHVELFAQRRDRRATNEARTSRDDHLGSLRSRHEPFPGCGCVRRDSDLVV
jgi:hypothetical protein